MNRDELRPCTCMYGRVSKMVHMANGELKETILSPGKEYNGYFHEWYSDGIGCRAIVETENGNIVTPYAEDVRFADRAGSQKTRLSGKNMNECASFSNIVNQLEACGYVCEGGPLERNTAFLRLKMLAEMENHGVFVFIRE